MLLILVMPQTEVRLHQEASIQVCLTLTRVLIEYRKRVSSTCSHQVD